MARNLQGHIATSSGFSLVELSIVLVILGLLVGGILGGQSLIRAAELRSITTDLDKFQTAINAFRGKYDALPGDMSNATDYWGAADATLATCKTTQGTGTQTCNGDGNGKIANMQDYTSANTYESFRAWQHLANAGLVEGSLTGTVISGNTAYPGRNIPASKIKGAGWHIQSDAAVGYLGGAFPVGLNGHLLVLGSTQGGGYYNWSYALTPEDTYAIDAKIDDGKPVSGIIQNMGDFGSPQTCYTGTAPNQIYNLALTNIVCYPFFKLGF